MKENIIGIWVAITYALIFIIVVLLSTYVNIKILYGSTTIMAVIGIWLSGNEIEKKIVKIIKKESKK